MGKLLRVPAPVLITLINISPLLIYGIIKLIIQPIMMLYGHHVNFGFGLYNASAGQNQVFFLYLGIGFGLMLLSTVLTSLFLLPMEEQMRELARETLPIIKADKLEEHHFHFWENFASPIATMFAVTWGLMFVLYIQFYYDVLHLINNGWEFFRPLLSCFSYSAVMSVFYFGNHLMEFITFGISFKFAKYLLMEILLPKFANIKSNIDPKSTVFNGIIIKSFLAMR